MSKQEAQGFEVAGYSEEQFGTAEAAKVINQFFYDVIRDSPAHAVKGTLVGDKLRISYMTSVVHLPVHIKRTKEIADDIFKSTVKALKDEFHKRTGRTLKLKEDKELGSDSVEKVSLNERYYYKEWRFYTYSF